jgi:hypothetical protein
MSLLSALAQLAEVGITRADLEKAIAENIPANAFGGEVLPPGQKTEVFALTNRPLGITQKNSQPKDQRMQSRLLAGDSPAPIVVQRDNGITLHQRGNTVHVPAVEVDRLVAFIAGPVATTQAKARLGVLKRYPAQ